MDAHKVCAHDRVESTPPFVHEVKKTIDRMRRVAYMVDINTSRRMHTESFQKENGQNEQFFLFFMYFKRLTC